MSKLKNKFLQELRLGIILAMAVPALTHSVLSLARSSVATIRNHASSMKWNTDSNCGGRKGMSNANVCTCIDELRAL